MIENKIKVGRFYNFTAPQVANIPHNDGDFTAQPQHLMYVGEAVKSGKLGSRIKTSDMTPGQHATKARRNFQWLTWLPGAITHILIGGVDVITGPMSGCDLVIFRQNGAAHAGHLGTDVDNPARNTAVKNAWNAFATNHHARVIGGFNPLRDWPRNNYPAHKGKDGQARIFGIYTSNHTFYTLFTYQQTDTGHLRVAGLERIPSKALHQLQNL